MLFWYIALHCVMIVIDGGCVVGLFTSATSLVVEEFARYIPFIGSIIAAPISFAGTYYMLKYVLDRLEGVALEVVTYAAEHAGKHEDDDDE